MRVKRVFLAPSRHYFRDLTERVEDAHDGLGWNFVETRPSANVA